MKRNRITLYIDLLFCLVIIPLAIMLLPVDRWITNNTAFLITLVAYVYYTIFCLSPVVHPQALHAEKIYQNIHFIVYTCFDNRTPYIFSDASRTYNR